MTEPKGTVHIETDRCKGCGLCTVVCPSNILVIMDTVNVKGYYPAQAVNPAECIGCGNCAVMCPDSVIAVKRFSRPKRRVEHA